MEQLEELAYKSGFDDVVTTLKKNIVEIEQLFECL